MQAESLFEWRDVIVEFIGFVASFLATGAIGFRYAVVRGRADISAASPIEDLQVYTDALRRAAELGLMGAIISTFILATNLPNMAARAHNTVSGLLATDMMAASQVGLLVLGLIGFLIASTGRRSGWILALIGIIGSPIRGVFTGNLLRLVNPLHRMFAGLWIGTLLVLLVAGIVTLLRNEGLRARRGSIAADMVNSFSPFALFSSAGVAVFGVITAWRHLHGLSNLWSTPYGYALIAKLCGVGIVVALGTWNWKKQRPRMGSDDSLHSINRSAKAELAAAFIVLILTGILVSIPSPRPPGGGPKGLPSGPQIPSQQAPPPKSL